VRQTGRAVEVESAPGEGATFHVRLPRAGVEAAAQVGGGRA
jgi:signal transduction histidine kinase